MQKKWKEKSPYSWIRKTSETHKSHNEIKLIQVSLHLKAEHALRLRDRDTPRGLYRELSLKLNTFETERN